ncbi:MAG: MMPL family transporter [Alphaproteobacteria bacterium]
MTEVEPSDGGLFGRISVWCVDRVQRAPALVAGLALLLAAAALWLCVTGLGINTSTSDMIAPDAPFKVTYQAVKSRFPERNDNITILIEADTPDRARDAAKILAESLRGDPALFPHVFEPGGGAFFARNGLLYLDREELLDLFDALADASPLLQRLRADTTLRGLFAVVGLGVTDATLGDGSLDDLDWLLGRMARAIDAALDGAPAQLSWHEILYGREAEAGDRLAVIIVRPNVLDYDTLLPGSTALSRIRALARDAGLTIDNGVRVSLTGGPALQNDELATVQRGMALVGGLSLVLISGILWWALGSLRLVVLALVTLLVGLAWTAGFAALAVGHLNLISIAFAVLFVSLGIDFSIHLCLAAREAAAHGAPARGAVLKATQMVGGSLTLCAVSTAIGFYAFLPTAYRGVSELGLIAGTGMLLGLVANLTLLPALLTLWPGREVGPVGVALPRFRGVGRRTVLGGAVIVAVAAALALPGSRFDVNPLDLKDQKSESVRAIQVLTADGNGDLWSAAAVAPDSASAVVSAARFEALPEVDHVVSLAALVPSHQAERLDIIADIAFALAPDPFASRFEPPSVAEQRTAIQALARALDKAAEQTSLPDGAAAMAASLHRLADAADTDLAAAEAALIGGLPGRLDALDTALTAESFGIDDLPAALVARYRGPDGAYRLDIYPAEDIIADNQTLARFVAALRTVDPNVTDDPVLVLEAGQVVIGAFVQALLSALVVVAALLYAVTRRVRDVAVILAPLCLAALVTGALTRLLGIGFNFANIIVLPLLFGIGVDSAIHLAHRLKRTPERPVFETSTGRAVLFSAMTTMAGFGSLALSGHPGTASMGLLLLLGVAVTALSTLLLIPALVARPAAAASRS